MAAKLHRRRGAETDGMTRMTTQRHDGERPSSALGDHPIIAAMAGRRSVPPRHLLAPGPSRVQIEMIVRAAATAPDHGRLQPYRFIHIVAERRSALAEVFVAATQELMPAATATDVARAREKALAGPELLALIVAPVPGNTDIPEHEQWAAAGAALAQLLLAAEDLGFAAMAVSGQRCRTRALRQALGLRPGESLLCFIALGTSTKPRPPRAPIALDALMSEWTPGSSDDGDG